MFQVIDEVMVVDPVDADLNETKQVNEDERKDFMQAGEIADFARGYLELEHHDGDDDGDDAVGEGFEAAWGEGLGHDGLCKEAYISRDL